MHDNSHLIEGAQEAIKNGHNTLQYNNGKEQRWWHDMYKISLYAELEKYKQGKGRINLN